MTAALMQRAWLSEALASAVVFLVALPLCLGVAVASGVPPALGIISGVIGGIIVGSLAGCPLQVSGPAAGLAIIVFGIVRAHGLAGLGVAVALAGLLQLAAGALKLGRWFRAVSPALVHGMLAGIGVLIIVSQLHVLVAAQPAASALSNIAALPAAFSRVLVEVTARHALIVGVISLLLIAGWSFFRPRALAAMPAPLLAVIGACTVATVFSLVAPRVAVPDNIFADLALLGVGSLSRLTDPSILTAALGLAFVASTESLLCATATDKLHDGPRTDYDRELVAQGLGNLVAGALGVLPVAGVIVRSHANIESGARTRAAAALHGVWLLLLGATAPALLRLIPMTTLAAILIYIGYRLIEMRTVRELVRHGRGEVLVYLGTAAGVVLADLLIGVGIGFACAIARLVWHGLSLHVEVRGCDETGRTLVDLGGAATFVRLPALAAALERVPRGAHVVLDVDVAHLDHASHELIDGWSSLHARQGGIVEVLQPQDGAPATSEATATLDGHGLDRRSDDGAARDDDRISSGSESAPDSADADDDVDEMVWLDRLARAEAAVLMQRRLTEALLSCRDTHDVCAAAVEACQSFWPSSSGSVQAASATAASAEGFSVVTSWSAAPSDERPALRLPLTGYGEALGELHIRDDELDALDLEPGSTLRALGDCVGMALSNIRLRERLRVQAVRDPLTGLFNRRYMEEWLARELLRARRHDRPLGLLMLDLDHFKRFNSDHGHAAGDAVLRQLGALLLGQLRGGDVVCRYGGEEFVMLLPEADLASTERRARQLREALASERFMFRGAPLGPVTASIGVAAFPDHGVLASALLDAADGALRAGKRGGRDRVVTAETSAQGTQPPRVACDAATCRGGLH